jgi:phosphoglycerate dehydrogenase-like enzyme
MNPVVVVQGVSNVDEIPELGELGSQAELRFACSADQLRIALPDADVMLCWDYDDHSVRETWSYATELRWIHYCAVGLDDALFPALAASSVCVTNAQ